MAILIAPVESQTCNL